MVKSNDNDNDKWAAKKYIRFFSTSNVLYEMWVLTAKINIPKFTRIGTFEGNVITETEYTKNVNEIIKNTRGDKLGTEYGIENKTVFDLNGKPLVIFPTDCKTGEISDLYKNVSALYANEPSNYRMTKSGELLKPTANSVMVSNYDTKRVDLVSSSKIKAGSQVLLYYGETYTRHRYKENCTVPEFWVYQSRGNLVKMPTNLDESIKPIILKRNKKHAITFTWEEDNWVQLQLP
jgi:hypothetical protein